MRRPDVFTLDYSHPLAQGLTHAFWQGDLLYKNMLSPDEIRLATNQFPSFSLTEPPWLYNSGSHSWTIDVTPFEAEVLTRTTMGASWPWPGVYFEVNGSSGLYLYSSGSGNSSANGIITLGSRNVITLTHTPGALTLYLNGAIAITRTISSDINHFSPLNIGGAAGVYHNFLRHTRALSPEEIKVLANRTDPMLGGLAREVNQVAYFDFGGANADTDNLTASDLVTGSPVLGTPALGQVHALTATGITTSAPALGSPALGQMHGLAATALTVSTPVLGTPAVGQAHSLAASALVVGAPVLGTPTLTENAADVDALTAVDLVVGSPVLGTPAIGQVHSLTAVNLSVASPALGTPSLEIGKDHLTAQDLITEGPVLGTPALRQIHALVASFSTAAPEICAPALTQVHALIPVSLSAGSPALGTPMLFDLEYMLQTRAELKSLGTTNFTSPLYGATHIELRCYGNYEVNEFGE